MIEERIALVEASQQVYQENIETAILCERERCAKIAEEYSKERRADDICDQECGWGIAKEIRKGE